MILISPAAMAHFSGIAAAVDANDKLPPPTRAAVLMALLGIALVGLLLVVAILLGGHWVRRQGTHRRGPTVPPDRAPINSKPTDELLRTEDSMAPSAAEPFSGEPQDGKAAGP